MTFLFAMVSLSNHLTPTFSLQGRGSL